MSRIVEAVRRHAVITAAGAAVLLAGAGVGTAAVVSSPGTQDVSDSSPASTSAAPATDAPPAAATPSAEAAADTPSSTVQGVTEPNTAQAPAPATQPVEQPDSVTPTDQGGETYDPLATYVDPESGVTYAPTPPDPIDPMPGDTVEEPATSGN